MSRLPERFFSHALNALIGFLFATGLGMPVLAGLGFAHMLPVYIIACALTALSITMLRLRRWVLPCIFLVLLLSQAVLYLFSSSGLFRTAVNLVRALIAYSDGVDSALLLYADQLCLFLAVFLTFLCVMIAQPDTTLTAVLVLLAMFLSVIWVSGLHGLSLYMLPLLPGVFLFMVSSHAHTQTSLTGFIRHLPRSAFAVSALLLLLAVCLAPPEGATSKTLSDWANRLHEMIDDHFFFQEQRTRYTLASDGWMPLGQQRLGGAPEPSDRAVLQVQTDETVYLRGAILDAYTGAAWYDSISARRYGWNSSQFRSLRREITQSDYPLSGSQEERTVEVVSLSVSASTLFTPQRIRTLTLGERMVAYFNTGSEIFITRNLQPPNAYSVSYLSMKATDEGMAALASQNAFVNDPAYAAAVSQYTAVPAHMQQEIYDIAASVTAQLSTPWQKATALRDYLRCTYPYTLNVQEPPSDVDFVAWFLLAEQKGYCTYFASAMTILCRMAGLPARYVEGYIVSPTADGVSIVTGENAHAWTEVYLNGVGWVVFDATPGYGEQDHSGQSDEYLPDASDPSPSPSPAPSPSPSPSPSEPPQPSSQPEESPTPTPLPDASSPEDTNTPAPPDASDSPDSPSNNRNPWLLLLLLLAAIVLLAVRIRVTEPVYCAAHAGNDEKALMILWDAICDCARMLGHPIAYGETPLSYAQRIQRTLGADLASVASAVSAMRYGRHTPARSAISDARKACISLTDLLTLWQKTRLTLHRALRFRRTSHPRHAR